MEYFSSRLKLLRKENNLTQNKLANILGYSRSTIAKYEAGQMIPSGSFLYDVAEYFEVSLDYLLGRTNIHESFGDYILSKAPSILLFVDPKDGKIIDHSPSALDFYGYKRHELLKKTIYELNTLPKDEVKKLMKKAIEAKHKTYFFKHKLSNDKIKEVKVTTTKVTINNRKVIGSLIQDLSISNNKKKDNKLSKNLFQSINNIALQNIHHKDQHIYNVTKLAADIGKHLFLSTKDLENLTFASQLQNIGEVNIPHHIINKPNILNENEYSIIKSHPVFSLQLLKNTSINKKIKKIILQHHERLDGSGYPNNLTKNEILIEAQIIGVADVIIAMISKRPYRKSFDLEDALKEINKNKGIKYNKEIVNICNHILKNTKYKPEFKANY